MERFVFVAAITIAILYGVGAFFTHRFNWGMDFDSDGGVSPVVEVAPGRMEAQTFAGAALHIRGAAANVTIIPEDRADFSIEIDNSAGRTPMPTVASEGSFVTIDGQLRGRVENCRDDGGAMLRGYGEVSGPELPTITIRAPRAVDVDRGGAGTTSIGASQSVDLDFSGCGSATIADTVETLDIDFSGSGDIHAGSARHLAADIAGSGELTTGAVSEGADFDVAGSGNVTMASLTGDFSADVAGSGNVEIQAGSIGAANIDIAGSGDIDISAPVRTLVVSMVGSGDVSVNGDVGDLEAEIAGAGNVSATRVTGNLRQEIFGPGEVTVGSRRAPAPPSPPAAPPAPNAP